MPIDIVRSEIEKNLGTQFDSEIGKIFLNILDNNYNEIREIQKKFPA